MTKEEVVERARSYVETTLVRDDRNVHLTPDTLLFGTEILDSLAAVQLLEFVQSEFDLSIANTEVTEANFGSLARIANFVLSKHQQALTAPAIR